MAADPSNIKVDEQPITPGSNLASIEKQVGKQEDWEEAVTVKAEPPSDGETDPSRPAQTEPEVTPETCGVCHANPPKYKCPRCYLPYCSVACNKMHREDHAGDPEPAAKPQTQAATPQQGSRRRADSHEASNPFRALDTSEALQRLFLKYPRLPSQLLEIHAATQPPKEAPERAIPASLMQGVRRDGWSHDVGIKNGKEALHRAKKDSGEAGKAIREYVELILHVMGEAGQKDDAAVYLQQQASEEDTKLIQRLMAEEQRKR